MVSGVISDNIGIYRILNTINNKVYIGCSRSIKNRVAYHLGLLNCNTHHCKELNFDWNKYGKDSFVIETIEQVHDVSLLYEIERYWHEYFKEDLYNNQMRGKPTEKRLKKFLASIPQSPER